MTDVPNVECTDLSTGFLDAVDDPGLHGQRADQPIEIRDDHAVGTTALHQFHGWSKAGPLFQRRLSLDVEFLVHRDELDTLRVAPLLNLLALLARRDEPLRSLQQALTHLGDAYHGRGTFLGAGKTQPATRPP